MQVHIIWISINGWLAGGHNNRKKKTSSKNKAFQPQPDADGDILEADCNQSTAPDAAGELADNAMAEAAAEQPKTWLLAGCSQPPGDPGMGQTAAEVAAANEPGQLFSRSFT